MPKQVVLDYSTGKVQLIEVPYPKLRDDGVIIKTLYSAVSIGTERLMIKLAKKNILGKALERPDLLKMFIDYAKNEGFLNAYRAAKARMNEPVPLGYSSCGVVLEVGRNAADEFKVGDIVACGGHGYASHAEVTYVPRTMCVKVPEQVDPKYAAFSNLGAIAIHSIRSAKVELGSNIAIIGLGLLGLICLQISKAAGAKVIGIDITSHKINLARNLGADAVALAKNHSYVETIVQNLTKNMGLDAVIIFASSKSSKPLELAAKIVRRGGIVVAPGWIKTHIPRNDFYQKEIKFLIPRSSGLGVYDPLYEIGRTGYISEYVRWTARENMKTFLELLAEKKVDLDPLISGVYPIHESPNIYSKLLSRDIKSLIGLLLEYGSTNDRESDFLSNKKFIQFVSFKNYFSSTRKVKEIINIGFIGAGQHAQGVLLPIIKKLKNINLLGVATKSGVKARFIANRWGFKYYTTDPFKIIEDPDIDAIFIVTRHNTHSLFTIEALKRGKYVFTEKPLAMTIKELESVKETVEKYPGKLMVGFNRRYSPFLSEIKNYVSKRIEPITMAIRVNSGYTPQDHWIYDPIQGGGRILSESCHFIDLSIYLVNQEIKDYDIHISGYTKRYHVTDNHIITLEFRDGSISNIIYTSQGSRRVPRELLEMFWQQNSVTINNFKTMTLIYDGKKSVKRKIQPDRGHKNMIRMFLSHVKNQSQIDQTDTDLALYSSLITILVNHRLQFARFGKEAK